MAAGLEISGSPPAHFDVAIDALLGLGASLTFSLLWRFQSGAAALSGLSLAVGVAMVVSWVAFDLPLGPGAQVFWEARP